MDYFSSLYREVPNDQLVSLLLSFCLVGKFVAPWMCSKKDGQQRNQPSAVSPLISYR